MLVDGFLGRRLQDVLSRRARKKFEAARTFVPARATVLDLGCGEGYVGIEAARASARPVLLDIRRAARVALPFVVADGCRLPFADDSFDVGFLAYVLHHTSDPDAVVRETVRTCRRVVVWESVNASALGRALLRVLDMHANALRGVPHAHLHLDVSAGWIARFDRAGATLTHRQLLGRFVHRHELFVFDRANGLRQPSSTRATIA